MENSVIRSDMEFGLNGNTNKMDSMNGKNDIEENDDDDDKNIKVDKNMDMNNRWMMIKM